MAQLLAAGRGLGGLLPALDAAQQRLLLGAAPACGSNATGPVRAMSQYSGDLDRPLSLHDAAPPAGPRRSSMLGRLSGVGVSVGGPGSRTPLRVQRGTLLAVAAPTPAAPARGSRRLRTRVAQPPAGAGDAPERGGSDAAGSSSAGQPPEPAQQPQPSREAASPPAPEQAPGSPLPDPSPAAGSGAGGGGSGSSSLGGSGGGGGPSAVTLLTRYNGIGYTFVLAGFLKIITVGGLAMASPADVARTAFGKASPYLMVPVGLGMCWVAKHVIDSGLHESKRFLPTLFGVLALLYFGLAKLMYKYEPGGEWTRRPRPRLPGQMSQLRADLGDRDLLAGADAVAEGRYQPERPGKELYDDVAWYEGRYPSQLAARGAARSSAAALSSRAAVAAASGTEDEYGGAPGGLEDIIRSRTSAAEREPATITVKQAPARRSFLQDSTR